MVTPGGASRHARRHRAFWRLLPAVLPGAVLASVNAARSAWALHVPQWPPSDARTLRLLSSHAATMAAPVERPTAPRLSGLRACSGAKRGDCRDLPGYAWIRRKLPEYAQCPSAALLGTLGGMSHATPATRPQTRGAPPLPTWKGRARTCPTLPNAAQRCPESPDALPVLGRVRDNLAHAVRHNGCPRYAGRADVDSTRSAAFPLRPPDALGSPHGFQLRGSSRLTAWRCASWRQARSVGHSAAGCLSPMQGQHATQNHQRRTAARSVASMQRGAQP
jgi:hypothetical protein